MRRAMITAAMLHSAARIWWAPLGLAALVVVLQLGGDGVRDALRFEREGIDAGQWWRLLSGHFVHLGANHAGLNLLGLLALLLLCPQPVPAREWLSRLACLALAISAGLYLAAPAVTGYVGLSGVLHGLFVLGLVPMARRGDGIAMACLLYLFGKIAWEQVNGASLSVEQAIGGHVVTLGHLFGTLAALVYGLAFGTFRRGETPQ